LQNFPASPPSSHSFERFFSRPFSHDYASIAAISAISLIFAISDAPHAAVPPRRASSRRRRCAAFAALYFAFAALRRHIDEAMPFQLLH